MMTTLDTIDHATLARMSTEGRVQETRIVGQTGGWGIMIDCGAGIRTLVAKRGSGRRFTRFETLVAYLKKLNILQFSVDASQYQSSDSSKLPVRADAGERLRHAHEAAAHDLWFRLQVSQAMAEADAATAVWTDHDVVKEEMAKERASL